MIQQSFNLCVTWSAIGVMTKLLGAYRFLCKYHDWCKWVKRLRTYGDAISDGSKHGRSITLNINHTLLKAGFCYMTSKDIARSLITHSLIVIDGDLMETTVLFRFLVLRSSILGK